jgi:tetratricopeptide (TPR) repeat protein
LETAQRYRAFISYSHSDETWATWLHRALEAYRVPGRLVGRETAFGPAPASLRPIFLDRGDLPAAADLKARVGGALERSNFLIVVCSPAAAHSRFVNDEILEFKRLHGEAHVLSVVVAGEPLASEWRGHEQLECFPRALRFRLGGDGALSDEPAEPIAADLRPGRDGRRATVQKLAAGMLGVGLDEFVRRDDQRRHNRLIGLLAASLTGTVAMGALTFVAVAERNEAQAQRNEARAQRAQAEGLIEFMLGDLKDKLEPVGRLDVLDAVGKRAMAYYAAQDQRGLDDPASLGQRARVMHLMGDLKQQRGDLDGALGLFKEAARSTGQLLARRPNDPRLIFDHAQSVYWVGALAQKRGQMAEARTELEAYRDLAQRLVQLDPANQDYREEAADASFDLGVVKLKTHRADEAAANFSEALAIFQDRAAKAPGDRDRQFELAQGHGWFADVELARGRPDAAVGHRLIERSIYQAILDKTPSDATANYSMVVNRRKLAAILTAQGKPQAAALELAAGALVVERLIALEPASANYREEGADTYVALATAELAAGQSATAAARRALELAEGLAREDAGHVKWRMQLGQARLLQMQIAEAAAAGPSARMAALAPAGKEAAELLRLAAAQPNDRNLAAVAAEAGVLAATAALSGRNDEARASWSKARAVLDAAQAVGPDPLDAEGQALEVKLRSRLGAPAGR